MKTKNYFRNSWTFVLFMLFAWMPLKGMAQNTQYELVVEKTDGSEQTFRITDTHPCLYYTNEDGVNTLLIAAATDTYIPCSEIKRLYTRVWKGKERDVVKTVKYITDNPSEIDYTEEADVNGDGIVNIADIIQIVNMILGK